MSYYEQLIKNIGRAMKKHPRSVVAMNSENFRVMATAKDSKRLSHKLNRMTKTDNAGVPVIFQKPGKSAVWIL
jgi:hypothetical protein